LKRFHVLIGGYALLCSAFTAPISSRQANKACRVNNSRRTAAPSFFVDRRQQCRFDSQTGQICKTWPWMATGKPGFTRQGHGAHTECEVLPSLDCLSSCDESAGGSRCWSSVVRGGETATTISRTAGSRRDARIRPSPISPVSVTRSSQATERAAQSRTVDRGRAVWAALLPLEDSKLLPEWTTSSASLCRDTQRERTYANTSKSEHNHQSILVNAVSDRKQSETQMPDFQSF
jgi:hypothetical protein